MALRSAISPSSYIRKQAIVRGVMGGSRTWLILGGTFWGVRILRQVMNSDRLIATEILKPGQAIQIEALLDRSVSPRKSKRVVGSAP